MPLKSWKNNCTYLPKTKLRRSVISVAKEEYEIDQAPWERHIKETKTFSMPNTYSQLYIQIVFAVKGRQNFITENIREETQKYMSGIIAENRQKLYAIYCMPDHTHILISM